MDCPICEKELIIRETCDASRNEKNVCASCGFDLPRYVKKWVNENKELREVIHDVSLVVRNKIFNPSTDTLKKVEKAEAMINKPWVNNDEATAFLGSK